MPGRSRASGELATTVTYGLYHGTKLTYHAEHLPARDPGDWPTKPRDGAAMQTVIRPATGGGIEVTVLGGGKPLSGAEVKLYCDDGHEEGSETTGDDGKVRFSAAAVEPGLNAIRVGQTDPKATGKFRGENYQGESSFLTATFFSAASGEDDASKATSESSQPQTGAAAARVRPADLADLPEELTSFGGAVLDGKLYVYGGHTGQAHSYSTAEQSNRLWVLDLGSGDEAGWKNLAGGPRLQGLALVAHEGRLIRIGGFTAMNEPGEEHDLQSQTSVAAYDPESGEWSKLPPLPEPRSSFDAAVLGDRIYVVGGWHLGGDSDDPQWHTTAWSLNLAAPDAEWQSIASPPSKVRAMSVAAHDGKLYVIGGMSESSGPTTDVAAYDPGTDSWMSGPSLPGQGMAGFGSAAFATAGDLYVTTYSGDVYRLGKQGKSWESVGQLDPGRFFHRMLPVAPGRLVVVGGANMEAGKFTRLMMIDVPKG